MRTSGENCRRECEANVSALHDLVNIRLGKPMRNPDAFLSLRQELKMAYERTLWLRGAKTPQTNTLFSHVPT